MDSPNLSPQPTALLQVGNQAISGEQLVSLLKRYGLMPALVKELVIDQAIAEVTLSAEEQAEAQAQFNQANQIQAEEQRQMLAAQRGLSGAELEALALRDYKLEKFKQDTWGPKVDSYFLQRKSRLDRVLYSLIRTREAGLAQELYFRIHDDGQPFADLAREYSEGQEAQTGGLIGPVELSVPHPALARILSISQPEQLWPPTRVGEWYVVVKLEKYLPAKLDDATRKRLLEELFTTWLKEEVQRSFAELNGAELPQAPPS